MKKEIVLILSVAGLLASCGLKDENARLRASVDSLKVELNTSNEMSASLHEVGILLDSIDQSRKLLRSDMIEGTSYENYSARLKSINDYVRSSAKHLEELEKSLTKSKASSSQYAAVIKKLKQDLEERKAELLALEQSVAQLKSENQSLIVTVLQKDTVISEKDKYIQVREQELATLETQFKDFAEQSKITEGDLYFAQAAALEEAAHRTKLAPRKKKVTQQEALELYRKALQLGNKNAEEKIAALEDKLS